MADAHQAIKVVAQRTGLSAHVIRIWEKRYGAVEPERTGTNRRLYSDDQVERLQLLRDVTQHGHSIGNVAKLPIEKLRELAAQSLESNGHKINSRTASPSNPTFVEACIEAVTKLDSPALERELRRATTELGSQGLLQRVIAPLAQRVGELWWDGTITAAHEHFATAAIRTLLEQAAQSYAGAANSPGLVVATPAGQIHELGALLAGAAAANLGWHVTYLGTSLPAAEIAGAARQNHARAVALSVVYPEDDPLLEAELTRLREYLPAEITLLVGGRAMPAYRRILETIGALQVNDLAQLFSTLETLRRSSNQGKR